MAGFLFFPSVGYNLFYLKVLHCREEEVRQDGERGISAVDMLGNTGRLVDIGILKLLGQELA